MRSANLVGVFALFKVYFDGALTNNMDLNFVRSNAAK